MLIKLRMRVINKRFLLKRTFYHPQCFYKGKELLQIRLLKTLTLNKIKLIKGASDNQPSLHQIQTWYTNRLSLKEEVLK